MVHMASLPEIHDPYNPDMDFSEKNETCVIVKLRRWLDYAGLSIWLKQRFGEQVTAPSTQATIVFGVRAFVHSGGNRSFNSYWRTMQRSVQPVAQLSERTFFPNCMQPEVKSWRETLSSKQTLGRHSR